MKMLNAAIPQRRTPLNVSTRPAIDFEDACGAIPVRGLLIEAKRRGLSIERLDLRNSGDTAGDRDRVVGYGAWAIRAG